MSLRENISKYKEKDNILRALRLGDVGMKSFVVIYGYFLLQALPQIRDCLVLGFNCDLMWFIPMFLAPAYLFSLIIQKVYYILDHAFGIGQYKLADFNRRVLLLVPIIGFLSSLALKRCFYATHIGLTCTNYFTLILRDFRGLYETITELGNDSVWVQLMEDSEYLAHDLGILLLFSVLASFLIANYVYPEVIRYKERYL